MKALLLLICVLELIVISSATIPPRGSQNPENNQYSEQPIPKFIPGSLPLNVNYTLVYMPDNQTDVYSELFALTLLLNLQWFECTNEKTFLNEEVNCMMKITEVPDFKQAIQRISQITNPQDKTTNSPFSEYAFATKDSISETIETTIKSLKEILDSDSLTKLVEVKPLNTITPRINELLKDFDDISKNIESSVTKEETNSKLVHELLQDSLKRNEEIQHQSSITLQVNEILKDFDSLSKAIEDSRTKEEISSKLVHDLLKKNIKETEPLITSNIDNEDSIENLKNEIERSNEEIKRLSLDLQRSNEDTQIRIQNLHAVVRELVSKHP